MQSSHHTLRVQGSLQGFEQAARQLREILDDHRMAGRPRFLVELVFEEIVTNVVRHGYRDDGAHHIDVSLTIGDEAVEMAVEDDGLAFDPLQRPDPVLPTSEAAPLGGLGILLVRRLSRSVTYERTTEGRNRLVATIDR